MKAAYYCCGLVLLLVAFSDAVKQDSVKVKVPRGLAQGPLNVAELVGRTVVLNCEADQLPPASRIMWGEYITNAGGSIISDNEDILAHPNSDRYRIIHPTATEYHLEIRDIRLTDGGTYMCQDTLAPPGDNRQEAELIVLAANPNCTNNAPADGNVIEGQSFTSECTINYQGGHAPTMTWSGPPPFSTGGSTNPTTVWAGVAYVVNRTMDTRSFECRTNFTDLGELPDDVASNIPEYNYIYRAPQLFVFWGPKNLYASPLKPWYEVGDTIQCFADAFPTPSFLWQNMRTLQTFAGETFTVTADMVGFNQSLRCEAKNIIQGFIYSDNIFIPVYVPVVTTPSTPPTTPPTTTQPLFGTCFDLTGYWISETPYAEMILEVVRGGQLGEVTGIFKNETATIWTEVVGTTRKNDYAFIGLSAIWPHDEGVTGLSGECHRCSGLEVILAHSLWRAHSENIPCGEGTQPVPRPPYSFYRAGTVRTTLENKGPLSVWKPTHISNRLGVNLKR